MKNGQWRGGLSLARIFMIVLLVLALSACGAAGSEGTGSSEYKADLLALIERSDRIVVTEHSGPYDNYQTNAGKPRAPEQIVYRARELDAKQKARFLDIVRDMDETEQDAFPACVFEPHHTIRFHAQDELISTMRICFMCGQVEWNGSSATPPWSLYSALAALIDDIGLQAERDWQGLAVRHARPD